MNFHNLDGPGTHSKNFTNYGFVITSKFCPQIGKHFVIYGYLALNCEVKSFLEYAPARVCLLTRLFHALTALQSNVLYLFACVRGRSVKST